MPYIEIRNLNYTYSKKTPYEKHALKNINLNIEEGTIVGLVGATGSGKSTLIQHLNGLIKIQDKKHSSVIVGGMSATDKKTLKKLRFEVGMVFQYPEYQLFGETVAKDVAFGPKNMKLEADEIDRRVRRALEVVGIDYAKFAERSPFDLSGGEKRRVAIAGVIAMEPKVLVLDEPVAGLDPAGREEILNLIRKLQKEVSPTVIIVSHNMDDMAVIADRIIALKDGEIVADGTPKQVFCSRRLIVDAGLDLPTAARLTDSLIARGIKLPGDIVTMEELACELEKLRLKKIAETNPYDGDTIEEDGVEGSEYSDEHEEKESFAQESDFEEDNLIEDNSLENEAEEENIQAEGEDYDV